MIVISKDKKRKEEQKKPFVRLDNLSGAEWTSELIPDKLTDTERRRLAKYKVSFRQGGVIKRLKNSGLNAAQVAQKFKGEKGFSLSYIQKAFAALSDKKNI